MKEKDTFLSEGGIIQMLAFDANRVIIVEGHDSVSHTGLHLTNLKPVNLSHV